MKKTKKAPKKTPCDDCGAPATLEVLRHDSHPLGAYLCDSCYDADESDIESQIYKEG